MVSVEQLFARVKQAVKTAVCCLLCIVLIAFSSYKTPVHASEIGVVAVDAYTAVIAGLAALGVGWAASMSDSDFNRLINKCNTTAVQSLLVSCTAAVVGGKTVYNLSKAYLTQLGNDFMTAYTGWQEASTLYNKFGSAMYATNVQLGASDLWSRLGFTNRPFPFPSYVTSYGITGVITLTTDSTGVMTSSHFMYNGYDAYITNKHSTVIHYNGGEDDYAFMYFPFVSSSIFGYIIDYTYSGPNGSGSAEAVITSGNGNESGRIIGGSTATQPIDDGVINTANKVFADGVSILNNSVPDVVGRVGDAVGTKNDAGEVVSVPVNVKDGVSTDVTKARDTSQEKTLGKDISTDTDRDKDKTTNKDKDTTPPKSSTFPDLSIPSEVFQKFPFCLPWDLYASLVTLQATAAPPKFKVPFLHKADWGLSLDITLDMSQFESVAVVCRWGFSIMWIIGLIFLTKKLIWK